MLGFVVLLAARPAVEVPRVLIVPLPNQAKDRDAPPTNPSIANYFAQGVDDEGRLAPIVWGVSDPIFRAAALNGSLGNVPDAPTPPSAFETARRLGADYVLLYSTEYKKGQLNAKGELFLRGRSVWRDDRTTGAQVSGSFSAGDTSASIARTWLLMLDRGPLKELTPQVKMTTPPPSPGQAVPTATVPPPQPRVVDNAKLTQDVNAALGAGKASLALTLARDAVDAEPLDPERRTLLVRVLRGNGDLNGAAEEATRAANLIPNPALRVLSVRALLAAGKAEEAQVALNEALARNPGSAELAMLGAETSLAAGKPEAAVQALERSLAATPTTDGYLLRALARAELGGEDGVALDLAEYTKRAGTESGDETERRYRMAMDLFAPNVAAAGASLRDLLRQATLDPKSAKVKDEAERLVRQTRSRSAFLANFGAPEAHRESHERRTLAQKLLTLAVLDLDAYLKDGSDDSMTDARINLGEALKQSAAAGELYAKEREGAKPSGSTHP